MSVLRGRPPGLAGGINGSIASHWASVKSLGYPGCSIGLLYHSSDFPDMLLALSRQCPFRVFAYFRVFAVPCRYSGAYYLGWQQREIFNADSDGKLPVRSAGLPGAERRRL